VLKNSILSLRAQRSTAARPNTVLNCGFSR
jgi:hypothetical protein